MKLKAKPSFSAFCRDILGEPISRAWAVAYKCFDGEPLSSSELETWRVMSGRETYTPRKYRELIAVKGRRSQGTRTGVKRLLYRISTGDYQRFVPKRQRIHAVITAHLRETSREVKNYFDDFYSGPVLIREVSEITKNAIELKNNFVVSVQTCSYRAPRGLSVPLGLFDEFGMWRTEGADVDREVMKAMTPAMIQFPDRELLIIGTPWRKAGLFYERWQQRFQEDDRLVLHCPTPLMNELISAEELRREEQADPAGYRREFLGEWPTDDVDAFLPDADIEAAIQTGTRELPPVASMVEVGRYVGAIDASGLGGKDAFTFGVAHGAPESGMAVDALRGWSRAPVAQVMDEIVVLAKSYGLRKIVADQFGFAFVRELLEQRGLFVEQLPFTTRSKPEWYLDMKLWFSQARIQMLDHPEALRELRMLESKRTSGGRYVIAAPRGQHDDYCALVTLLVNQCKAPLLKPWIDFIWTTDDRRGDWRPLH